MKVYFARIKNKEQLRDDLGKLFDLAFKGIIKKGDSTALKVHFGELGNTTFVKPFYVGKIIEKIKEAGAKPFLTDTNTLYKGHRHNSEEHMKNAMSNGFNTLNTPIRIADQVKEIEVDLKFFKKVKIAKQISEADSIIVSSHMTGHLAVGFGCALKNISMGCASRAGKQQMHSGSKPKVNQDKCIACKKCAGVCPENCIAINDKAFIDQNKCIGCDECVTVCPTDAIAIMWGELGSSDTQERVAEYAYGAVKGKRVGYISFLIDITPDCDCFGQSDKPFVEDIGILASLDPVAIDKAGFDLVNKAKGVKGTRLKDITAKDKFKDIHGIDSTHIFKYAEKIGLGKKDYELIEI